jgi:hypothetical protein
MTEQYVTQCVIQNVTAHLVWGGCGRESAETSRRNGEVSCQPAGWVVI